MLPRLPDDVWPGVTAHLCVAERLALARVCRAMCFLAGPFVHGDLEQAVRKHQVHVQLRRMHDEWAEVLRMRSDGLTVVRAPERLPVFLLGGAAATTGGGRTCSTRAFSVAEGL